MAILKNQIILLTDRLETLENKKRVMSKEIQNYFSIDAQIKIIRAALFNIYRKIEKYSKFQASVIGDILSTLMSALNNQEFVYRQGNFYFEKNMLIDGFEEKYIDWHHARLIASYEEIASNSAVQYPPIDQLIKEEKALVLEHGNREKFRNQTINFYRPVQDKDTVRLESTVDYGNFSYVQDFIDYVIEYKITVGKLQLSRSELKSLMWQFILMQEFSFENLPQDFSLPQKLQ